jgi:hypothetical protein
MYRSAAICALTGTFLVTLARGQSAGAAPAEQVVTTTQPDQATLLQEIRSMRAEMHEQQLRHEQQIQRLQTQIDELKKNAAYANTSTAASRSLAANPEEELDSAIATAAGEPATTQTKPAGTGGGGFAGAAGAIQSFNPDISVNADFLGAYSPRKGGLDTEQIFRELEIGLSQAVDPYTTATAIITVGREDDEFKVDLEEGYLTFTQLPYGLQARAGQFRSDFGKTNPVHLHALPWIDYPLVIKRFFGEEGLSGAGGELSWVIPHTGKEYISLTYQVTSNDNDSLFAGEEAEDVMNLVHLKTFRDLSPTSNLEIGASFATAPNDDGHGGKRSSVEGVDVTYHWKPRDAGSYRSLLLQAEVMAAQADLRGGQENTWGGYAAADYQFAKQWKLGLRYDYTQLPVCSSHHESAYSTYLTFLQSEFVFWRFGYMYTDRNFQDDGESDETQLFLQLNWTYGMHPAHKY